MKETVFSYGQVKLGIDLVILGQHVLCSFNRHSLLLCLENERRTVFTNGWVKLQIDLVILGRLAICSPYSYCSSYTSKTAFL